MAKEGDVAKHLSFEDVSMHSPGVFSRFEAQRAREQPTVANLRRCALPRRSRRASRAAAACGSSSADESLTRARRVLSEVAHATEHHERILSSAVDKSDGLSDADLKRLKYVVTNLKGGVLELGAHARFVEGACCRPCNATLAPNPRSFVAHASARSAERELEPGGGVRAA